MGPVFRNFSASTVFLIASVTIGCAEPSGAFEQPPASSLAASHIQPESEPQAEPDPQPQPQPQPDPQPQSDPQPEPDPSYGHADLDADNDWVVGPPEVLEDCEAALDEAGVRYKKARIGVGKKVDGVYTCGAHQVVRYKGGPGKIGYGSSPTMTCQMALAMSDFETILQEEAERHLGSRVKSIKHLGTYNCRKMANYDWISEHSFANGIDLAEFTLENGKTVTVLDHFKPKVEDEQASKEAMFMRVVARRLYDEDVFSNVITPYFDRLHRNHIHVDLARYRTDGARP